MKGGYRKPPRGSNANLFKMRMLTGKENEKRLGLSRRKILKNGKTYESKSAGARVRAWPGH